VAKKEIITTFGMAANVPSVIVLVMKNMIGNWIVKNVQNVTRRGVMHTI
jgi:hypothetical protein